MPATISVYRSGFSSILTIRVPSTCTFPKLNGVMMFFVPIVKSLSCAAPKS